MNYSVKKRSTKEILKQNLQRTSPLKDHFILWLHNIRSLHNVGSAFRSADAFGVHQLWISGYTPVPPRPEITKTAIGAEEHVSWKHFNSTDDALSELKKRDSLLVGLEQTNTSEYLHNYKPDSRRICLVLGNEVTGIDKELIPHLDKAVEIPQFGMKHSLNVSVAAGIALFSFFEKFQT